MLAINTGLAVSLTLGLPLAGPQGGSLTLILAGIAISAMAAALTSLVLPFALAGGAIMLQLADIAVRLILPSRDLKLAVATALVGAPLFRHLVYKT